MKNQDRTDDYTKYKRKNIRHTINAERTDNKHESGIFGDELGLRFI